MPTRTTLLALLVAFGAVACAPPALDPDHASGSSAESTGKSKKSSKKSSKTAGDDDDTSADVDDDDTGATTKPKATTGSSSGGAPASFAAVYSGLKTSCGSCHLNGTAGAPTFFGANQSATYDDFVNENFNTSPSPLVTKGQHSGPALTAAQQSAVEAWVADETK